jgi:hypothetical protein
MPCFFISFGLRGMFNWFKRKKSFLQNWHFEDILGFEMIQNSDSIQYVNKDASKTIYFSVLNVSGSDVFSIDSFAGKPTIIENINGWQLKGAKKFKNQVLICVISVSKQNDVEWAKIFFDSITSR